MTTPTVKPMLKQKLRGELPPWFGPMVALVVLMVFTVSFEFYRSGESAFLRPQNLINIPYQWSFVGIIAVGMTLAITLGGIDLSVGSLAALVGGLGIWCMNTVITAPGIVESVNEAATIGIAAEHGAVRVQLARMCMGLGIAGSEGWGLVVGLLVMMAAGPTAGLVNGLLIAKGRIAPLIVTLGGLAAYRSLALALADGGEFRSSSATLFGFIGQKGVGVPFTDLRLPYPILIFALVAVIGHLILHRMRLGRYIIAIGCNQRAAEYSAVPVDRVKVLTYTLVGATTAVSAILISSRMNSVSSGQTGLFYELDAIAAVVIGGTRMTGGSGTVIGTVIGVLMLGVIGNMLNMLDAPIYLQGLVKGVIIIGAVLIQRPKRQ